ncbi:MAG: L-serine ammonia-lyase, iron-sulfur-dependent, subunit alpha [Oscillospiraceae bacterium]|nr:L-serine ammonia-lyase, iron-sulfur-dependent, subunit alpha [Oscillospiraceae bacterium]
MINYYPDFFNDVFGPVMQPGSSSHTAGPCRLGLLAHSLLQYELKEIVIELDKNGSFAGTFGLMREDLGMLSGAYGLSPDDERMFDIKEILLAEQISYEFRFIDFPPGSHPNAVKFILTGKDGKAVSLLGNSTGGGMIETVEINGVPCKFIGDGFLTVCSGKAELPSDARASITYNNGKSFIIAEKDALPNLSDAEVLFSLPPILPVCAVFSRKEQLFRDFTGWKNYAEKNNISLAEAAIEYEKRASGLGKEEIIGRMKLLRLFMREQTESVYKSEENILEDPFSGYHFRNWRDYEQQKKPLSGEVTALAVHYAFGVQALKRGVKLVPGPMGTGGGYLYSALRAVSETCGCSEEGEIEALLVAAGVGAICYSRTNPTGEILGCTGECGVCGAMAAAAITHMCGGSPAQVEAAASLMLQASVGWPCDPIPGGQNQPCISRVLTAVTMSITFADLALSGKNAVIPFHEVVDEAHKLASEMPASLKCTSCGGMCETPAAKKCRKEFDAYTGQNK